MLNPSENIVIASHEANPAMSTRVSEGTPRQAQAIASSIDSLHVVACINQQIGGPAVTVPTLASALGFQGAHCVLAALDDARYGPVEVPANVTVISRPADALARRLGGWSPGLQRELLCRARNGIDIVHNHGLWLFPNLYARQSACFSRIPLVISPRGMLDAWSMKRSRAKKAVAWHLYERRNLESAALFHATSQAEADSVHRLGLSKPVAMIPNGVTLPAVQDTPSRIEMERRFPRLAGKHWLLFLSRLHPKKGVGELLRAWSSLADRFPDWQLIVAGPDLDGYEASMRAEADSLGLTTRVDFTGMVAGPEKACLLGHATLFVLPTHSENFGIAVAEALSHAVPVITTRGAPWAELLSHRCGWWIEQGATALEEALSDAMTMPADELRAMGRRGYALVESRYAWDQVATDMKAVYLWLCGRGPRPACVQTA
jgi:glycosyltransferase involved in cell wall biosynthesis